MFSKKGQGSLEYLLLIGGAVLVAAIVIALVIMVGVLGVRFYWAEIVYAKALQSTDYKVAESWLKKSSYLHQSSDVYHVTLAKVYLGQATQEAQMVLQ